MFLCDQFLLVISLFAERSLFQRESKQSRKYTKLVNKPHESLFQFAVYNLFCLFDWGSPDERTTGDFTVYFEDPSVLDKLDTIYCGIPFFPPYDLYVHTVQFCDAVSAVISARNFLDNSVGGRQRFCYLQSWSCEFSQFWIRIRLLQFHDLAFSPHEEHFCRHL